LLHLVPRVCRAKEGEEMNDALGHFLNELILNHKSVHFKQLDNGVIEIETPELKYLVMGEVSLRDVIRVYHSASVEKALAKPSDP
jgi:hypothetical protein